VTIANALQLEAARRRRSRSKLFWSILYRACAQTAIAASDQNSEIASRFNVTYFVK